MSLVVDVEFDEGERQAYLDEVRQHLPAFLSEVAYGRAEPIEDVSALLNLRKEDLDKVISTHLGFTEPIIRFIEALPEALRRPLNSSLRPAVVSQSVRGPVDWAATHRVRNQRGGDRGIFVVRPSERIFDNPENQTFVWLLRELALRIEAIRPAERDPSGIMGEESWFSHILDVSRKLDEASRHRWLGSVTPVRPTAQTMGRLRSARTSFYAQILPDAIETFIRYTERPGPEQITDLLCERYFEPRLNWQLFELVISLRLARELGERLGTVRSPSRLMVGGSRGPFARYEMKGGDVIQLWYQAWPDIETRSLLREARDRHALRRGSTRPDLVIERRSDEGPVDVVLIEVKASRNPMTLGQGLVQMLGYVNERPDLWPRDTPAWLTAPPSDAFRSGDAEGEPLWMVTSDDFAAAAADRLLAGQGSSPGSL